MVELMVLAAFALTAVIVFAALASALGMVMWAVFLPFRILGWILHGLAVLLVFPVIAVVGVIAFLVLGAGMLMFFIPLLPFVLIALGAWWLVRRNRPSATPRSTASAVS